MTCAGTIAWVVASTLAVSQVRASTIDEPEATESAPQDGWDEPSSAAPSPEPMHSSSPPPPAAAPPATPLEDPPSRSSEGRALVTTGAVLVALGAAALVFVAVPSAIVKEVAMNRAERAPLVDVDDRERRYHRARLADNAMEGSFWGGLVAVGVGIPLLVTGVVLRNRAREDLASRLELNASGVALRF